MLWDPNTLLENLLTRGREKSGPREKESFLKIPLRTVSESGYTVRTSPKDVSAHVTDLSHGDKCDMENFKLQTGCLWDLCGSSQRHWTARRAPPGLRSQTEAGAPQPPHPSVCAVTPFPSLSMEMQHESRRSVLRSRARSKNRRPAGAPVWGKGRAQQTCHAPLGLRCSPSALVSGIVEVLQSSTPYLRVTERAAIL